MALKVALGLATLIMTVVGVALGAELGLMGLVIINVLMTLFMHYDRKVVVDEQVKWQLLQLPQHDVNKIVKDVIKATSEIVEDYNRAPVYIEEENAVVIGIATNTNSGQKFIPLFQFIDGALSSTTYDLGSKLPESATRKIQISDGSHQVMPYQQYSNSEEDASYANAIQY